MLSLNFAIHACLASKMFRQVGDVMFGWRGVGGYFWPHWHSRNTIACIMILRVFTLLVPLCKADLRLDDTLCNVGAELARIKTSPVRLVLTLLGAANESR